MKPRFIATMAALAGLSTGHAHAESSEFNVRLNYERYDMPKTSPIEPGRSRRKAKAPLSQRQNRKQRRRAHAAGKRHAFR